MVLSSVLAVASPNLRANPLAGVHSRRALVMNFGNCRYRVGRGLSVPPRSSIRRQEDERAVESNAFHQYLRGHARAMALDPCMEVAPTDDRGQLSASRCHPLVNNVSGVDD